MDLKELANSRCAWVKMNYEIPAEDILVEFKRIQHLLVNHRSDYSYGWQSLTLHGHNLHWTEAIDRYPGYEDQIDSNFDYHWTELAKECPSTTRFISSLPYSKLHRVRFMLLRKGGYIRFHRDTEKLTLSPLNISINNPKNCSFIVYDNILDIEKLIPFENGTSFHVNIGLRHAVFNNANEDRLHIIVHGNYTDDFISQFKNLCFDYDREL